MDMRVGMAVWTGDIEVYLTIGRLTDRDTVLIDFSLTLLADILCDGRLDDGL